MPVQKSNDQPLAYLSPREQAVELKVTPRTLKRWRQLGKGPPYIRLSRQRVIYPQYEKTEWARERTYSSRSDELARTALGASEIAANAARMQRRAQLKATAAPEDLPPAA
jgi:hypothetical protein